jgi:putative flavoprotein involved in K+ transport
MRHTDTIIIGGGQAGLAMSRCLSERGLEHLVLERGRVAERWRSERWDSLRLLTPNWQSRLPGWRYQGGDPDGFMTMPELIAYLEGYAAAISAPVETGVEVEAVRATGTGYEVSTTAGPVRARAIVLATGACDEPYVPGAAGGLTGDVHQSATTRYRNPDQLPPGAVLVAGASAAGVQLAGELRAAGREVTMAVGRHTRVPRTHRGRDLMWWLDAMGVLAAGYREVRDLQAARREPSLQLIGSPERRSVDLARLQAEGVRLTGRLLAADGHRISLAGDLPASTAAADARMARLLDRIDRFAAERELGRPDRPAPAAPVRAEGAPTSLDLAAEGITTVVWATGFRRRYPWLRVPVLDERGELRQDGGVTPAPGLYALGLPFLRRRRSTYIDGVGDDARTLAAHIAAHLGAGSRAAA